MLPLKTFFFIQYYCRESISPSSCFVVLYCNVYIAKWDLYEYKKDIYFNYSPRFFSSRLKSHQLKDERRSKVDYFAMFPVKCKICLRKLKLDVWKNKWKIGFSTCYSLQKGNWSETLKMEWMLAKTHQISNKFSFSFGNEPQYF